MQDTRQVHMGKARKVKRIARGVRMPASLWAAVDELAETEGLNGGRLIERWVTERVEQEKAA